MPHTRSILLTAAPIIYFLLASGTFAFLVPPLEAPDEPNHLAYINRVAAGTLPNQYDQETRVLGQGHQHPLYYLLAAASVRAFKDDAAIRFRSPPNPRHVWHGGTEFCVPRFDHSAGNFFVTSSDERWFYGLRLASVLLGAVNLFFVMQLARQFLPDDVSPAFAGFLVATLPQFLFISATVNNDNLANLLTSVSIVFAFRILAVPQAPSQFFWLGVSLGLALLTKKTVLATFPVTGLILVLAGRRQPDRLRFFGRALLVPALILVIAGWWFARNAILYQDAFGAGMEKATLPTIVAEKTLASAYFREHFPRALGQSFVGLLGWMNVPLPALVYGSYFLLGLAVLVGLFGVLVRKHDVRVTLALAYLVLAFFGIVYYNLTYNQPQGRYFFPVIAPLATLVVLALRNLVARLGSRGPKGLAAGLLLLGLVTLDGVCLMRVQHFYSESWGESLAQFLPEARPD